MQQPLQDISDKLDPELKVSVVDIEEGTRPSRSGHRLRSCISILQRSFRRRNDSEESPWPKLVRKTLYLLTAIVGLATIAVMYEESSFLKSTLLILRQNIPLPSHRLGCTVYPSQACRYRPGQNCSFMG